METTFTSKQTALFEVSLRENAEQQGPPTPAELWNADVTRHALDELVHLACQYRSSESYQRLIAFVARFRFYSPFNAMLIHIQMPGATFVAPAHRWDRKYCRKIKPNAHPLVILQPRGPVMFVFDVAETEPRPNAPPLPPEVEKPFEVRSGRLVGKQLEHTIENAKRDGIRILGKQEGSQSAGLICKENEEVLHPPLQFKTGKDKDGKPIYATIPVRYSLVLNENLSREARYATMVHELAHLYCGHLGTPNRKWWPDRRGLTNEACEFEAESTTYLVCGRLGIDNPSDQYIACYLMQNQNVPKISPECIMKTAGLIEEMGQGRLKLRKD